MEIKRKEKTLAGLFLNYVILFCVNTVMIVAGCTLLLFGSYCLGMTLPSDYAEMQLMEYTSEIQKAGEAAEKWIPKGCTYGIYDAEGNWKEGNLSEQERKKAWNQFEKQNVYASTGKYYRYIKQNNGDICIVKYDLYMKYSYDMLNDILPTPEVLSFILDGVFFVLNAWLLSKRFAQKLNMQLGELRKITEKITENNLEFEIKQSDIREINDVMVSFSHMKDALNDSLKTQWDMEQQKQEQLTALAHDIKTPLTIIRGNAELLAEEHLSAENRECTDYILTNVGEIEQYLERMKQVLYGTRAEDDYKVVPSSQLGEKFREMAIQLVAAEKVPISFDIDLPEGEVFCSPTCMLRAWNNILSNGVEHTDKERGIEVNMCQRIRENQGYLVAYVRDFGKGFSSKDLMYADKEFYSGDTSRHDRRHQGLGLAITKRFLEEQGGFLEYRNCGNGGAEVTIWIKMG